MRTKIPHRIVGEFLFFIYISLQNEYAHQYIRIRHTERLGSNKSVWIAKKPVTVYSFIYVHVDSRIQRSSL